MAPCNSALRSTWAGLTALAGLATTSGATPPQCPTALEREVFTAPDGAASRAFGGSVALDGATLVVGADGENQVPPGGAAYVYARSGAAWSLQSELQPAAPVQGFGYDVDVSGSTVAVGSPFEAPLGAVHVYVRVGSQWTLQTTIVPPGPTGPNSFGRAVALDGDTLAVGSPSAGSCCPFPGEVSVFVRAGSVWSFQQTLSGPVGTSGFGSVLDVAGSHLAAAIPSPVPFDLPGFIETYERSGSTWTSSGQIFSGATNSDGFGRSLELDGDRLALGLRGSSNVPEGAQVFHWLGTQWSLERVFSPIAGTQMEYGWSVAIDGDRLAVGAIYDDESGVAGGSVHLYENPGTGWQPLGEVFAALPSDQALFGEAVALSGTTLAVGAPSEDTLAADSGAAYAFAVLAPPASYCTAQVNSLGCLPKIEFLGTPSASSTSFFFVTAVQVLNQKSAILFYGLDGQLAAPFQGGTLCVRPPLVRTPVQNSGGSAGGGDCSGSLAFEFNAWTQSGTDPRLAAGVSVDCQYWSRDPQAGSTVNLTDALEFVICPR